MLWIKNGDCGNFDNAMGAYDGAEMCELVGYLQLNNFNKFIYPSNYVLYKDDGLNIIDKCTPKMVT